MLEEKKLSEEVASAAAKRKMQERMAQSGKKAEVLALWKGIGEAEEEASGGFKGKSGSGGSNPCAVGYLQVARVCRKLSHQLWFQHGVTVAILIAAALAGIETDKEMAKEPAIMVFNFIISIIFTIEVVVKVIAEGFKPWNFLRSGWNCFDLVIVALAWLPTDGDGEGGSGGAIKVVRLLRLARVLKLVRALPQLQIIVQALFDGLSSIFYIAMLLFLLFYVFAIFGIMFFRRNDPLHWESLAIALVTLFRMSTMEDWTDIMYINLYGCTNFGYMDQSAWIASMCNNSENGTEEKGYGLGVMLYFIPFIILSALVLMSLFIGVITTSMESAAERQREEKEQKEMLAKLQAEYQVSNERIAEYKQIFAFFDADGGGSIDRDEFRVCMRCIDEEMSNEQVEEWLHIADENQDDEIQFVEFANVAIKMEFDRDALERERSSIANQRLRSAEMLKKLNAEGLPPKARLQGEGLEKVARLRCAPRCPHHAVSPLATRLT